MLGPPPQAQPARPKVRKSQSSTLNFRTVGLWSFGPHPQDPLREAQGSRSPKGPKFDPELSNFGTLELWALPTQYPCREAQGSRSPKDPKFEPELSNFGTLELWGQPLQGSPRRTQSSKVPKSKSWTLKIRTLGPMLGLNFRTVGLWSFGPHPQDPPREA